MAISSRGDAEIVHRQARLGSSRTSAQTSLWLKNSGMAAPCTGVMWWKSFFLTTSSVPGNSAGLHVAKGTAMVLLAQGLRRTSLAAALSATSASWPWATSTSSKGAWEQSFALACGCPTRQAVSEGCEGGG